MAQEQEFDWTIATAERAAAYLRQFNVPLDTELQGLLNTHLPPNRLNEKVDAVSAEISAELGEIVHNIDDALHSTGNFGLSLEALMPFLGGALSPRDLKMVVEALADATKHVAEHSRALERRITASKAVIQDLHQELEAVRAESLTDEMTGLANRRRFGQVLKMEVFEARETGDPLCLALVDVDNFKRLNDSFGHQAGDRALRVVAQMFQHSIKAGAHACRYGGEEFVLVLPRTELAAAVDLANTIRGAVKARELVKQSRGQSLGHVTLSIGVAAYRPGEPVDDFVHRADAYLYAAKEHGRDRVEAEAA
ncbi:MAG TPA: GGDEF domain-containing protein [Methyloceanibacter sp.]|nr:GGDEF domain-containing protein [Methyloceanibacter sp.]